MARHGCRPREYRTFTDARAAHAYVGERGAPIVVKADGLAAGKGVVVAQTRAEADAAIDAMLVDNAMGDAGARVVIEDFLAGEEASFIVMVDGRHVLPLASSQDHKRLRDGDAGPTPAAWARTRRRRVVTPAMHARIMREVIVPAVNGMAADGMPYTGFLYAGVMIDAGGQSESARIQLPAGRPRNAADHGAARSPTSSTCSSTRSPARSTPSKRNGTAARRWASCSRRPAIPTRRARATRSKASTAITADDAPGRPRVPRGHRAVRRRPPSSAAAACCA